MDLNAPKLRRGSEISGAATFQLNSDLWEISVPPEDDVVWCIVLSFLISEDFKPPQDLNHRLTILTDSINLEENVIEKVIKSFNPFQDKYSCFENDAMKKVIEDFKTSLNWDKPSLISEKINDASFLLNRRMYVITDGIPFNTSSEGSLGEVETIVLFSSLESGRRVFSFGIKADFCRKKRKEALLHCFKQIRSFRKEISFSHLKDLVTDDEDLLISLLKSNYTHLVPDLLDSPSVMSKAIELGYSLDAKSVDSDGISTVYRAIMSCDTFTCYRVYYFAVQGFQLPYSYRIPTSQNIRNLQNIDEILSNDQKKSNNFENSENPETSKILFYSSLCLNKFLMETNRKLLYFNTEKLDQKNSPNEDLLLATIEQKKMLWILNTYLEYFNPIELRLNNVNLLDDVKEFKKCKSYCQAIDIVTCLFFFDHIHHLKTFFAIPNIYPDIESDCFILALTYAIFGTEEKSGNFQALESFSGKNINILYEIPLNIRKKTVASVECFCKSLKNFQATPRNKTLPEFSSILRKNFKIRNYLRCSRLKSYFSAAETIQSWSRKTMLVIERLLQVIGENMIVKQVDKKRLKWFLYLYLPEDIEQILYDLRNSLSHYEFSSYSTRLLSEKQFFYFREIQREISVLHDYLKPLFNIINLHINAYVSKKLRPYINRLNLSKIYRKKHIIHHLIHSIPEASFKKCYSDIHQVFSVILGRIDIELDKNQPDSDINKMIYPLIRIIKSVQELLHPNDKKLLKASKFSRLFPFLKNVKENTLELKPFLYNCKIFVKTMPPFPEIMNAILDEGNIFVKTNDPFTVIYEALADEYRNFIGTKPPVTEIKITDIEALLTFQLILTSTVLTDDEKDIIRNEIPPSVRDFVDAKNDFKNYRSRQVLLENPSNHSPDRSELSDFGNPLPETFSVRVVDCDFHSNFMLKLLPLVELKYYPSVNFNNILNELSDPIEFLEDAFSRNYMELNEYMMICRVMKFPYQARKLLRKLCFFKCEDDVEKTKQKNINKGKYKLSFLLDRIELMENILITENSEISRLWINDKGKKCEREFFEKVTNYFLRNSEVKTSIEMMFLDCMELFRRKGDQNDQWRKISGMYDGIYLRNVLAHGDLLLENLCELLDPSDLPLEILKKVVDLIRDKDCIEAILNLYSMLDENIVNLENFINYPTNDQQKLLSEPINKCGNNQRYIDLLKNEEYE